MQTVSWHVHKLDYTSHKQVSKPLLTWHKGLGELPLQTNISLWSEGCTGWVCCGRSDDLPSHLQPRCPCLPQGSIHLIHSSWSTVNTLIRLWSGGCLLGGIWVTCCTSKNLRVNQCAPWAPVWLSAHVVRAHRCHSVPARQCTCSHCKSITHLALRTARYPSLRIGQVTALPELYWTSGI